MSCVALSCSHVEGSMNFALFKLAGTLGPLVSDLTLTSVREADDALNGVLWAFLDTDSFGAKSVGCGAAALTLDHNRGLETDTLVILSRILV